LAVTGEIMGGDGAVLAEQIERARRAGARANAVVLVEGASDQRAVSALARRQGRDLDEEGVVIIPTAGATNVSRFVDLLGPAGHDVRLAGLCDEAEEAAFQAALEGARIGSDLDRPGLEALGFFVCSADLEEELIRALGTTAMVDLIESQGELRRFHSYQRQPAQRHKAIEVQLWGWLGNHKIRYASLMVEALHRDQVPSPLLGVLASV
jgi:hypothetical protein